MTSGVGHSLDEHEESTECEICFHLEKTAFEEKGTEVSAKFFGTELQILVWSQAEIRVSYHATYKALRAPPLNSFS